MWLSAILWINRIRGPMRFREGVNTSTVLSDKQGSAGQTPSEIELFISLVIDSRSIYISRAIPAPQEHELDEADDHVREPVY